MANTIGSLTVTTWNGDIHLNQVQMVRKGTAFGDHGNLYQWVNVFPKQSVIVTETAYKYKGTVQTASLDGTLGNTQGYKFVIKDVDVRVKPIVTTVAGATTHVLTRWIIEAYQV